MEFYLEALDRDIKKPHENPSVGIILCKSKDEDVVEYALSRNMTSTMISEYRTKLISKEVLRKNWTSYMKRQMKAKTLNSVERISKIKFEIAAMECNRSVAAAILRKRSRHPWQSQN